MTSDYDRRLVDRMSLDAFRIFETAARNMNFTAAARELAVTQAAVSRRIQKLEADLQTQLFRRVGRRLTLTAEGETLYRRVKASLDFSPTAWKRSRPGTKLRQW